jgi:hypothetical protein
MEKEIKRKNDYSLTQLHRLHPTSRNRVVVQDLTRDHFSDEKPSAFIFVENNTLLVSLLSALFVPYMLGMLLTLVLFYFYVGVSVTDFFHVYSGFSQFVFWVLGAYLIITVADIWLLSRKFILKG